MSLAHAIAPHLPYLRRYARALTGTQGVGDKYVAAALEAIVADPGVYDASLSARVAIYKVFSRIWNSLPLNGRAEPRDIFDPADRRIEAITPLPRQAFLLTAVEGFDLDDAAEILNVGRSDVGDLVDEAGRQISEQVVTDVLVIEDEPVIAMDIESLVESLGHRVIGNARTHREAVAMVKARKPGLVLADIQLADGSSGLDAVNDILREMSVPVIFITAYPERLLTGERPEPTFLVTKPFRDDAVKAVISQALFFDSAAETPIRAAG